MCTGQQRVRRCSWCRRATSSASCSWPWTRIRGDPMVHADEDLHWLELFAGVHLGVRPQLVRIADEGGARVLAVGERPLTGPQLHVRAVLDVTGRRRAGSASAGEARSDSGDRRGARVPGERARRGARLAGARGALGGARRGVTVLVSCTRSGRGPGAGAAGRKACGDRPRPARKIPACPRA